MAELTQQQLDFMLDTTESLARIETNQNRNIQDVSDLCKICAKIPAIEIGLNNHLATHDKFKKRLTYPIYVTIVSGMILAILHYVIGLL